MYKKNVRSLPNGHKWPAQYNNVSELSHNGQKRWFEFCNQYFDSLWHFTPLEPIFQKTSSSL